MRLSSSPNGPQQNPEHRDGKIDRRVFNGLLTSAAVTAGAAYFLFGGRRSHEREVLEAWEQERELFEAIEAAGGFQNYIDSLTAEQRAEVFQLGEHAPGKKCSCCVDEGIRAMTDENGHKEKLCKEAGSGILPLGIVEDMDGFDPFDPHYIRTVAHRHNAAGINEETYHEQCGAAAVAFKNFHGRDPQGNEAFEYARSWSTALFNMRRDLLARAGNMKAANALRLSPIEFSRMRRPSGLHIPRVIYYGVPHDFESPLLPQGYGVDREDLPANIAMENAKISKTINFSTHGPGHLFTPENQQLVVCVGNRVLPANQLMREAEQAFQNDPDYCAGKIRITGFDEREAA